MYHNTIAWQKIAKNVYDADGKIVFIRQKFLTSPVPIIIGGASVMSAIMIALITYFTIEDSNLIAVFIASGAIEAIVGGSLLFVGLKAKSERDQNGGIHPKDTVYILDSRQDEVRRQAAGEDERIAKLSETTLGITIERDSGSSRYFLELHIPTKEKITLLVRQDRTEAEKLLSDIKTRLGIPEVPTQT